jgi:zinc ribbon protein
VDAFPLLFLMLGVMVWFACGILGSFMAQAKGRTRSLGFFLGFVFGPFGLIRAAMLSPDEHGNTRRGLLSGELRKCPDCAEPIRSEARKCRYCGAEVSPIANL